MIESQLVPFYNLFSQQVGFPGEDHDVPGHHLHLPPPVLRPSGHHQPLHPGQDRPHAPPEGGVSPETTPGSPDLHPCSGHPEVGPLHLPGWLRVELLPGPDGPCHH